MQDAEAALAGAQQAHRDAEEATAVARAFRDGLHADLRAGGSESAFSATDLATADAVITRAELLEVNARDQVPHVLRPHPRDHRRRRPEGPRPRHPGRARARLDEHDAAGTPAGRDIIRNSPVYTVAATILSASS